VLEHLSDDSRLFLLMIVMRPLQALNVPKDNVAAAIKRGVEGKTGSNMEVGGGTLSRQSFVF